ncbi:MAG: folylpolyglutamate synthase/dihydrofolate synthase family protein [Dongiaceae bacterium]
MARTPDAPAAPDADLAGSDRVLERLNRLHPKIIDLGLDRVADLLDRVGRPQDRLPPVVHVAGTNGKGSVIAYLRAMLEAAGYRVHVYTSPHLVRFHERIRLAGSLIDEQRLIDLLEQCERANDRRNITFFEITTVAAFLAFAETPADILLLETGLGGRLDATNMVDRPLATVITPISMDHMSYLGDTLGKIAFEKAGIMKAGVPAIVGAQPPEASSVFDARAAKLGVALVRQGREWTCSAEHRAGADGMRFRDANRELHLPHPALAGAFQIDNAGMAIATLPCLGDIDVREDAIRRGLGEVSWPARMQHLTAGSLVSRLPPGWELWVDGGHNESAGAAIASLLRDWVDADRRAGGEAKMVHLVFGMLNTKQPVDYLRHLMPYTTSLQAVSIGGGHQNLTTAEMIAAANEAGIAAVEAADTIEAAVARILETRSTPARILCCGSLYFAGEVLAKNG